jgi:hypothetical protein
LQSDSRFFCGPIRQGAARRAAPRRAAPEHCSVDELRRLHSQIKQRVRCALQQAGR